ncbi:MULTISPECIES: hypothetical protein [Streptomyces]|uniref:Uncharacterized protein n=1 Tax=Streptomyces parvus TaxID=66428 RepID=A0A5D4IP81_9ACTN|nr:MULTISPECIES: hypothetical protein [Streptomyces]PVC99020.1 hypothetical protein DBP12_13615 [Streptomyces sp. CS014]TYR54927.1 hypothetical protein FY004_25285 [Streptomyces parvus]
MTWIDEASWTRSLRALFGEGMFAAVGARRHDDWRRDALDVMRLATADPRAWPRQVSAPGGDPYAPGPNGPFGAVTPNDFVGVFPVPRRGAEQIVVTLQGEWFQTEEIPDFPAREAELISHARGVLDRFGGDSLFFTNAVSARNDPHADMFRREGVYEGFTEHAMDCGVIALSATEVGVFWGFTTD